MKSLFCNTTGDTACICIVTSVITQTENLPAVSLFSVHRKNQDNTADLINIYIYVTNVWIMSVFGDTIWHPTLKRGRARLFKEEEFWLFVLINEWIRTVRKRRKEQLSCGCERKCVASGAQTCWQWGGWRCERWWGRALKLVYHYYYYYLFYLNRDSAQLTLYIRRRDALHR